MWAPDPSFLQNYYFRDVANYFYAINKEKARTCNADSGFWSEWGDSNSRHLEPKSSALPTGPHPDIEFEAEKEILTVVVKTVVKPQF